MQQSQNYRCPNCQTEFGEAISRCPMCGMALQRDQQTQAFTKIPALDAIIGVLVGLVAIATGIGMIGSIIVYFRYRQQYPYFCMGLLISGALLVLVILGILLVCFGGIAR
ncbi:hypothetical protein [Armatimonas sp.]|uniref:hypothetical protein n=1 Tax=Armatimonas sp. TaxID=1872638 RepID=UPI00286C8992|nr:hypothetical protein [Armatimonas sp.]